MELFAQYGIAGAILGVLFFVLKENQKRMKNQDNFMENLITNHLKHHTNALEKLSDKIDKMK